MVGCMEGLPRNQVETKEAGFDPKVAEKSRLEHLDLGSLFRATAAGLALLTASGRTTHSVKYSSEKYSGTSAPALSSPKAYCEAVKDKLNSADNVISQQVVETPSGKVTIDVLKDGMGNAIGTVRIESSYGIQTIDCLNK
jgi:hypothetical protein